MTKLDKYFAEEAENDSKGGVSIEEMITALYKKFIAVEDDTEKEIIDEAEEAEDDEKEENEDEKEN